MDMKIKQNTKTESSTEPQSKKKTPIKGVSFWRNRENVLFLFVILAISFMVYLPSLQNGFVTWDDDNYIYENPLITSITGWGTLLENTKDIFTTPVNAGYIPLVILSFAFEKMLYGFDRPGWWHFNNIILHLICVLFVFRIALALGLKIIPAAFCALLFGIHPMRVESVAWITERKDLLYVSFYLLSLYYYIKSVKLSLRKRYFLIILAGFILALLSKIQAVTLPLSMLLVDYYFDRKLSIRLVYEKWHYFLLSLATGIAGIYFLKTPGISKISEYFPFSKKLFFASYSFVIYFIKSVVPYEMVPVYPFPDSLDWTFYASMVLALSILSLIVYFFLRKKKVLVFGLLFFTFNIMFVLQIKISGYNFLADRYTYIAYWGLFFMYACGFQWVLEKYKKFEKLVWLAALFILGLFGYMNYEQNKIWKDGETFWSHTLKFYPNSSLALKERAKYYTRAGKRKEATEDLYKAIKLDQTRQQPINNKGVLHLDSDDPDTLRLALQDFTKAIQTSPDSSNLLVNRARTYIKIEMFDDALQDFNEAERLDPSNRLIYDYRAQFFYKLGQYDKAQADIEKFLNLNPADPAMWSNLGTVSRLDKQYEKSLNAFNRAIQINPDRLNYYYARLKTYYEMGEIERARNDLNFLKSKGFKNINPNFERMLNQGN
jgi:tetratricopeptide (TPR) repeat protein